MRKPLGVVFDLGDTPISLKSVDGVAGASRTSRECRRVVGRFREATYHPYD